MKDSTVAMLVFFSFTLYSLLLTFKGEFFLSFASILIAAFCWLIGITLEREGQ